MTHLRLSEAARQVGVSRPTIYKYAADGLLSVTKDRLGHKQVELSELLRVFGELSAETQKTTQTDKDRDTFTSVRQPVKTGKTAQTDSLSALLVELERARAQLESKVMETALLRERVDELKARERTSQEERSRLMAMLEQSQRLLAAPQKAPRTRVRSVDGLVISPTLSAESRTSVRRKADVPVPATRIPTRKKASVTAPVAVLVPVAVPACASARSVGGLVISPTLSSESRASARKEAAVQAPIPTALAKTGTAKKSPVQKTVVSRPNPR